MKKIIELSTKVRVGFGTGEWSDRSKNCIIGCSNDCAYCYSRATSMKNGLVADRAAWPIERIDDAEIAKRHFKVDGLVMFPTHHDTTPANIQYNLSYLRSELEVGNYVLFVSKASLPCIKLLCNELDGFKDQLLFRITIGSMNQMLCKFWERNAPSPKERLLALKHAFDNGFETSVSMEPILHGVEDAIATFNEVEPFVTERIWVGAMNSPDTRVDTTNPNFKKAIADLKKLQAKKELVRLYTELKGHSKVEWKESIKNAVGLK